jgi:surfactin synthase thioesterase subunit
MNKINVFCLPFAGGSKYSFWSYQRNARANLNLIPLELPGRGSRMEEPLMSDIHKIVEDIFEQIKGLLHQPYAIYGHSMGTLSGYLLTKKIIALDCPAPLQLFFTGSAGPSIKKDKHGIYNLPRVEFFTELKKLGGVTEEVLNNAELMEIFEPVIRSDFRALSAYEYQASPAFDIPLTVMTGSEESISSEELMTWQQETVQPVTFYKFPGNHFFIFNQADAIMNMMSTVMAHKTSR